MLRTYDMSEINSQQQKTLNKKWVLQILILLQNNDEFSYKNIHKILKIPTSTLSERLRDLTEYKFIQKHVYGNARAPHYTDYKITEFGLNYINNLFPNSSC